MDHTRDSTNPFVGLAFKLEVKYLFFIWQFFLLNSKILICHAVLFSVALTGREVWPADVRAGVPGLPEEGGIHLQHTHEKKGSNSEARASPR